ncbi:Hypothetical protein BROD_1726 [Brucella sp. NF 2653]|nr:Hypothetical protein BROD_1726 [Brucella sp. NF 2653]
MRIIRHSGFFWQAKPDVHALLFSNNKFDLSCLAMTANTDKVHGSNRLKRTGTT